MTYIKVLWTHEHDAEPIELFSELDDERHELRKVEVFRNGSLAHAGPRSNSGQTLLSEVPLPSLQDIGRDPAFHPALIDQVTFERIWNAATIAVAA